MDRQALIERAVQLARENVENGGEPFGAIIVKDGEVIGEGVNRVQATKDPTAHAEIEAIRVACEKLGTTDLSDCELYASGEPCPMCLSTMYWTNLTNAYIAYTVDDGAPYGLSTQYYYDELALPKQERAIQLKQLDVSNQEPHIYKQWKEKTE